MNPEPATPVLTGILVVRADPTIRIRGTVDYMSTTTPITGAYLSAAGLDVDYGDQHEDFPDGTITLTLDGLTIWEDYEAKEYPEDQVALLTPDGQLHDLPCERSVPAFVGDVEWARRLLKAALPFAAEIRPDAPDLEPHRRYFQVGDLRRLREAVLEAIKVLGEPANG